jgi:hypothetical protein
MFMPPPRSALGRVGSVINDVISVRFPSPVDAYWLGLGVCAGSAAAAIWASAADKRVGAQLAANAPVAPAPAAPIQLRVILTLPRSFWLVSLACVAAYSAVYSFMNIAADLYMRKFLVPGHPGASEHELNVIANNLLFVPYLVSALLTPLVGIAVDRFGHRGALLLGSSAVITLVHVVIGFTSLDPLAPAVVLGVAFAVFSGAVWPAVALTIPRAHVGTAYGAITAVQCAGLAASPVAVATLSPPAACGGSYACVELLFVCIAGVGTLACVALCVVDGRAGGGALAAPSGPTSGGGDAGGSPQTPAPPSAPEG